MREHTVRRGETLGQIAHWYTGDVGRARELLLANPVLSANQGNVGKYASAFREGVKLRLPASWGMVGATDEWIACNMTPIHEVKEYRWLVRSGDWPQNIAERWFRGDMVGFHTTELLKANYDFKRGIAKLGPNGQCQTKDLFEGDILKIPRIWPDPPDSMLGQLVNADGTPYVPGGGGGGGGGQGDEGLDTVRDDGDSGTPTWLWVVLGVGGAVGLGLLATGALKKKRTT